MDNQLIHKVKTGEGPLGTRMALLFAPAGAQAGSLTALTDFLNEQPHIRAVPGYYGKQPSHVLRISGLTSDTELRKLLQEDFPIWQEKFRKAHVPAIDISPDLHFGGLQDKESYPDYPPVKRFIKERANGLTALAYMVGNTALLFSVRHQKNMVGSSHTDWFKVYSSVAYNVAAISLAVLGGEAERATDVNAMMQRLYPKLQKADQCTQQEVQTLSERTMEFLKRHPWEINAAINASGASAHLTSALRRRSMPGKQADYEALAAMGTITSMAIAGLMPEKPPASPEMATIFDRGADDSMLATAEHLQRNEPRPGYIRGMMGNFKNWARHHPLALSAGISAISNIGYGVAAARSKPVDVGLMVTSGSYLAGNMLQSQAHKVHSASFDEIASGAASIICADPLLEKESAARVQKRIDAFASALTNESQVAYSKQMLKKGIAARLKSQGALGSRKQPEAAFIAEEIGVLRQNPFASNRFIRQLQTNQQAGVTV